MYVYVYIFFFFFFFYHCLISRTFSLYFSLFHFATKLIKIFFGNRYARDTLILFLLYYIVIYCIILYYFIFLFLYYLSNACGGCSFFKFNIVPLFFFFFIVSFSLFFLFITLDSELFKELLFGLSIFLVLFIVFVLFSSSLGTLVFLFVKKFRIRDLVSLIFSLIFFSIILTNDLGKEKMYK
ncbi:hypothetical protein PFLG_00946 [Plasmodium falciparum RAJ116]|uniref:Uncharacterized protein n=1 Tax=Plasmodium falciparum RAJ116 TaxID=580058 RepID=A0A0L0CYP1_PLAFA|nr:hypothetical protein PFLG_00946 [Plasmodium falciparum RAJ116]